MAAGSDLADLFIVGADFYPGSTGKRLKRGWCDFDALGLEQARKHFGNNWNLGKAWYFAKRVPRDALKGFEEHMRQNIWLRAQGSKVVRVIIDPSQGTNPHNAFVAGREFSFRTEADALAALKRTALAPQSLLISAGIDQRSLLTFLDEEYDQEQQILLPPESQVEDIARRYRLEPDELDRACLKGDQNDDLWKSYMRSRNDRVVVASWLDEISDSEERQWLYHLLRGHLPRSPKDWLTNVHKDPAIFSKVIKRIEQYLKSNGTVNNRLARDRQCIAFIGKNLIQTVASHIANHEALTTPQSCTSAASAFEVLFHDRFSPEYRALAKDVADKLRSLVELLKCHGLRLKRPHVGHLNKSRHSNMKALRFRTPGGAWRLAFAFDPHGQAILLVVRNKAGYSNKNSFYVELIRIADERFDTHLATIRRQRKSWK
jgi:hypothetical protein